MIKIIYGAECFTRGERKCLKSETNLFKDCSWIF